MFEQFVGFLLLGLGVQNPLTGRNVKGETTVNVQTTDTKNFSPEEREILKEELKKEREATRATLKEKHELLQQELKEKREDFLSEVKTQREETKAEFEAKREAYREKFTTLRDEKKKDILENLAQRITKINAERIERMTAHVAKMNEILQRIVAKAAEEKDKGRDTASVDSAVSAAQSAIVAAQDAVAIQAGKEYIVAITSETNLKNDVGLVKRTLESDMKAVHEKIVAARKAVSSAIRVLATLRGETVPEEVIK